MTGGMSGRYSGQAAFVALLVGLLACAGVLAAVGWISFEELSAQTARYRAYRDLQRGAGKADSLSAAYAVIQKDVRLFREALPESNQGSFVLNILVEEARKLQLGIAGITAMDEVPFPGYRELPFELGLTGGFLKLVRYLHSLETRGMVLQVRRLSARSEAINKAGIKAKLEISVFVPGNSPAATIPAATIPADGESEP
jgi:hypothetical protein